jgi:hypothetical protein
MDKVKNKLAEKNNKLKDTDSRILCEMCEFCRVFVPVRKGRLVYSEAEYKCMKGKFKTEFVKKLSVVNQCEEFMFDLDMELVNTADNVEGDKELVYA